MRHGAGPVGTGLVLASAVAATAVFVLLFTRVRQHGQRDNLMGPLAVLTCAMLVLTILRPRLAASLAIFSVLAAFGVYHLPANTAFVLRVPTRSFHLDNRNMDRRNGANTAEFIRTGQHLSVPEMTADADG